MAGGIVAAGYGDPTTRYPHGAPGDPEEHVSLAVRLADGRRLAARLPDTPVFEDTAPRLADLDGDGSPELAYADTPHLGQVPKIVRLDGDRLVPVAEAKGLTNHRFGDTFIQGRIATCDGRKTILTASADRSRIIGTTLANGRLTSRDLGSYRDPTSFDRIAGCDGSALSSLTKYPGGVRGQRPRRVGRAGPKPWSVPRSFAFTRHAPSY